MTASVSAVQPYAFNDAGSGKALVFPAGAPAVGQWDVVLANSDGLINLPTGAGAVFSTAVTQVSSQAAYIFVRQATGGETDTITVTTPQGNVPAEVVWARVTGADAVNLTDSVREDSSPGTTAPALPATPTVGDLGLALVATHNQIDGAAPAGVDWGTGWTEAASSSQGSGGTAVWGSVGINTPADDPQSPATVTWTNRMNDRYLLLLTFTPAVITVVEGELDTGLPAVAATTAGTLAITATTSTGLPPLAVQMTGAGTTGGAVMVTLPALAGALQGGLPSSGTLAAGLPALTARVAGFVLVGNTLPALTGTATVRGLSGTAIASDLGGTARVI